MSELPKAWGVLYAHPNPDGTPKLCANCAFFMPDVNRCSIHNYSVKITPAMVCGYHVFGFIGVVRAPVDPKLSGLENVLGTGGSTCGSCKFFRPMGQKFPGHGLCYGVAKANGQPPQQVETMGCCARWERRE